jgi:hypothetical protein
LTGWPGDQRSWTASSTIATGHTIECRSGTTGQDAYLRRLAGSGVLAPEEGRTDLRRQALSWGGLGTVVFIFVRSFTPGKSSDGVLDILRK